MVNYNGFSFLGNGISMLINKSRGETDALADI